MRFVVTSDAVPPDDLLALRECAADIGIDTTLIQAAGGNVSIKSGTTMWIKASGTWLADARDRDIMVPVALHPRPAGGYTAGGAIAGTLRPSIETSMHAALPHAVVVHVHSVDAIALAVRRDAEAQVAERLDGLRWAFVSYHRPGQPLTDAIVSATRQAPADVLVLANHGLVIAAEDVTAAQALLRDVIAKLEMPSRVMPAARFSLDVTGYREPLDPVAHAVAIDPISAVLAECGALYPDHVVFLNRPLVIDDPQECQAFLDSKEGWDRRPAWLLVRGRGVAVRTDAPKGADAMLRCLADVSARIGEGVAVNFLTRQDIDDLLDWDAERYRRAVAVV